MFLIRFLFIYLLVVFIVAIVRSLKKIKKQAPPKNSSKDYIDAEYKIIDEDNKD